MAAGDRLYSCVYPIAGGRWQAIMKVAGKNTFLGSANSQACVFLFGVPWGITIPPTTGTTISSAIRPNKFTTPVEFLTFAITAHN